MIMIMIGLHLCRRHSAGWGADLDCNLRNSDQNDVHIYRPYFPAQSSAGPCPSRTCSEPPMSALSRAGRRQSPPAYRQCVRAFTHAPAP